MESDDFRSETDTPTHTTNWHNHGDEDDDSQLGSPNDPKRPGGPNGPGGPGGLGRPGNNPPNEQDFLQEFMNLLRRISILLNNPQPNNIHTKVK